MEERSNARIESEIEVKAYLQNLKFALNNGAELNFQVDRYVDKKHELLTLSVEMFPYKKNQEAFPWK